MTGRIVVKRSRRMLGRGQIWKDQKIPVGAACSVLIEMQAVEDQQL